jgi:hypothetical protein
MFLFIETTNPVIEARELGGMESIERIAKCCHPYLSPPLK